MYVAQACAALLPLVVAPIVIRTFGLEVFGAYASLMAATQFGLIISEYSFDAVGPRILLQGQGRDEPIYELILSAKLPLMLVGSVGAGASFFLFTGQFPNLIGFVSIAALVIGTAALSQWLLIATGRILLCSILIGGARLLSAFAIVLSAIFLRDSDIDGTKLFAMYAAPVALAGFIVFFVVSRRPRHIIPNHRAFALLRDGFPAFLGASAVSIQNIFGQFIVGFVAGPVSLGIYNAIDRPARMLSASLKPIFQTLYPYAVKLHQTDPRKAIRFNSSSLLVAAVLGTPVVALCALFSETIVGTIYGPAMIGHHHLLAIIVSWIFLGILNNFVGIQGLLAAGKDKAYSGGMWLSLLVALIGSFVFMESEPYSHYVASSIAIGELTALALYSAILWGSNAR